MTRPPNSTTISHLTEKVGDEIYSGSKNNKPVCWLNAFGFKETLVLLLGETATCMGKTNDAKMAHHKQQLSGPLHMFEELVAHAFVHVSPLN